MFRARRHSRSRRPKKSREGTRVPTIAQLVRKGRETKTEKTKTPGAQGLAPAPRRLHPRLHPHAQEAELRAAQGRPRPPHHAASRSPPTSRAIGHNLQEHSIVLVRGGRVRDLPGVRYKIIRGALDASRRREPQAGPQPLRRQEGRMRCRVRVPPPGVSSCPTRSTGRWSSPSSSTRCCCAASARRPSTSSTRRSTRSAARPAASPSPRSSGRSRTSARSSR